MHANIHAIALNLMLHCAWEREKGQGRRKTDRPTELVILSGLLGLESQRKKKSRKLLKMKKRRKRGVSCVHNTSDF